MDAPSFGVGWKEQTDNVQRCLLRSLRESRHGRQLCVYELNGARDRPISC